jgi:RNA recognition motif-containing protein
MAFYDYWLDSVQDWWERFTTPRPKTSSAFTGEAMRIYVGNLSYAAKDEELTKLFAKYGKTLSVDIIRDRFSKKPKGYAFVEMPPAEGQKALDLNGSEFLGRKIVVSQAKSKERPARQEREQGQGGGREQGGRESRGGRGRRGGGEGRRDKQGQPRQQQPSQGNPAGRTQDGPPQEGESPRRGKGPRIWKGRNKDLNLPKMQRYED